MKKIIIAIDGFSSCGKSTMAKQLAKQIGYIYVDSGAMYRAITLKALRLGTVSSQGDINEFCLKEWLSHTDVHFSYNAQMAVPETILDGENVEKEIRSMAISSRVSLISALPFVREKLVELQQKMGEKKCVVMDGRDIGTTVFPDAEMKVFVIASPQVRAQRRFDELIAKGETPSFEEVLKNVQQRDYLDTHREVSPLVQASDAVVLDNSNLSREQQLAWLMDLYRQKTDIQ